MPTPAQLPLRSQRLAEAEAWWALVARILAFLLGAMILSYETLFESNDRLYLTVAGIGLCGPVVAQSVAVIFAAMRGTDAAAMHEPTDTPPSP